MAFRLEDKHLVKLAERFPKNWDLTVLGEVALGLKDFEVESIKTNHPGDVKQAAYELLKMWKGRQRDPGDAYHLLRKRLRSVQDFTSLATSLEQWVERGMDQPDTSTREISDIQQAVRDYLEVELEDSLYNDWLKCDDRKALPLMDLYTDLKWTIKVKKRVRSDQWEERSSVFDILPGQQDKPMKILVEAAAGMGKTSTVSYLAMNWVQHNDKIPFDLVFQVPLRVLNQLDSNTSLAEIIQSSNGLKDVPSSRVEGILRGDTKSKVLLILDGYDEYNGKITALNEIVERNVNSFFLLITSRPGKDPKDETYIKKAVRDKMQRQVMIEGFTDESIEKCCQLFLDDDEELMKAMLQQVRQKSAIESRGYSGLWELLRTPITLLMMCALFEQHGTLPKTRTQIYKQIRELSLERTLNKPDSPQIKNLEETLYRLGEFAWKALQEDNLLLNKGELQENDGDILRLGLLHEVGVDSMSLRKKEIFVTFQHKTIQEFVAAEYLAKYIERSPNKKVCVQSLFSCYDDVKESDETVAFCVGLMVDPTLMECVKNWYVESYLEKYESYYLDSLQYISVESDRETILREVILEILQQSPDLSLYNATLTGLLPELLPPDSPLQSLHTLSLIDNKLNELDIMHLVGLIRDKRLPALRFLHVADNTLTGLLSKFRLDEPLQSLMALVISNAELNKTDIQHLAGLIKDQKLPALYILSLSNNKLTGLLPEFRPDETLRSLEVFILEETFLEETDIKHLGSLLRDKKLPTLSSLHLSKNILTGLLRELFPLDVPLQSLSDLHLSNTGLDRSDVQYLSALFRNRKLPALRILHLSDNTLTGLSVELFPLDVPLQSLTVLHLSNTGLDKSDVQHLSALFQNRKLPALRSLYLSENTLTGLLVELFPLDGPLQAFQDLNLSSTGLDKSDVKHLSALFQSKKVSVSRTLDLTFNNLGQVEHHLDKLIEACVYFCRSGLRLNICSGNKLSCEFFEKWAKPCAESRVDLYSDLENQSLIISEFMNLQKYNEVITLF